MAALPTGTVTFLFTDIEGSTRLLQRLGPDYAQALGEHQALLRAAFAAHGGAEVDTQGDAFLATFATAPQAVAAAAEATRALAQHVWPRGATLRVRMGLHTGTPTLVGGHYVGLDLHRAARVASAGHGGQILLSQATVELVREALPADASLRDLGSHRLKDLDRPEPLFQLVLDGLPADFPPLKTLDRYMHNLPVQSTPLLGREEQVAVVSGLLRRQEARLLTVTGAGGIGKTRLGLQVATELIDAFPDGVWFVRLSRLTDPTLVLPTIAQTLGLRESGEQPMAETLRAALRAKHLLLVLDNFEQVVGAAAEVGELLEFAPDLQVLVTSRTPLHLRGEVEYALRPLALPNANETSTSEQVTHYAAVALFIERAQRARADFAVTAANAPVIAEICVRLDGLPLAIELAAARVKLFPPEALLARLASRLKLLTGGPRDLDERQQTMRAAIAWSEHLLATSEQALFRRLAVFVGGCTLEAIEAVCLAPPGVEPLDIDVLDGVSALVDQSLLQQREEGSEPRFGMLQVIREYALERLDACGEADALSRAHAHYFSVLAEEAAPELTGPLALEWSARLAREDDNVRAALEWAHAHQDPLFQALASALCAHWTQRGRFRDAVRYLAIGLAGAVGDTTDPVARHRKTEMELTYGWAMVSVGQPVAGEDVVRRALDACREAQDRRGEAEALEMLGFVEVQTDQYEAATRYLEQALAIDREIGHRSGEGVALATLGLVALYQGRYEVAAKTLEQSLAIKRALGDRGGEGALLGDLAEVELWRGRLDAAAAYTEQSLAANRTSGFRSNEGVDLSRLGTIAQRRGQLEAATAYFEQALAIQREVGARRYESAALGHLGQVALLRGRLEEARAHLEQTLVVQREIGDRQGEATQLSQLGLVALRREQPEEAERYFGESLALRRQIGDRRGEGTSLSLLSRIALLRGQPEGAEEYLGQALAIHREIGDRRWEARSTLTLGQVALARGDMGQAEALFRESLTLAIERALGVETAEADLALGRLLAERLSQQEEGCQLLSEAARRFTEMGMPEAEEARAALARNGC